MLNRKALLLVFCCFILSTISPLLYGQATGSFSGTVTDKTGSVIAGATVRVTAQAHLPDPRSEDGRYRALSDSVVAGRPIHGAYGVAGLSAH